MLFRMIMSFAFAVFNSAPIQLTSPALIMCDHSPSSLSGSSLSVKSKSMSKSKSKKYNTDYSTFTSTTISNDTYSFTSTTSDPTTDATTTDATTNATTTDATIDTSTRAILVENQESIDSSKNTKTSSKKNTIIPAIVTASVVFSLCLIIGIMYRKRKTNNKDKTDLSSSLNNSETLTSYDGYLVPCKNNPDYNRASIFVDNEEEFEQPHYDLPVEIEGIIDTEYELGGKNNYSHIKKEIPIESEDAYYEVGMELKNITYELAQNEQDSGITYELAQPKEYNQEYENTYYLANN